MSSVEALANVNLANVGAAFEMRGQPVVVIPMHGRMIEPTEQTNESRKVTISVQAPMMSLAERLDFIRSQDDSGSVQNIVFVDMTNKQVLAGEEIFNDLMKNPHKMPEGFTVRKVTKEEAEEMLKEERLFLEALVEPKAEEASEKDEDLKPRQMDAQLILAKGYKADEELDEATALVLVSTLVRAAVVESLLRNMLNAERNIVRRMWEKFSEQIREEAERGTIRAREDSVKANELKAELLKLAILEELVGVESSILELRDRMNNLVAVVKGLGNAFSHTKVKASAAA